MLNEFLWVGPNVLAHALMKRGEKQSSLFLCKCTEKRPREDTRSEWPRLSQEEPHLLESYLGLPASKTVRR